MAAPEASSNITSPAPAVAPVVEKGKRRRDSHRRPRVPRNPAVLSTGDSNLPKIEATPVATGVIRLEQGLYAIEIVTAPEPVDDVAALHRQPVWLTQTPPGPSGALDVLSAGGGGDQWLQGKEKIIAVRAPRGGALLMATVFGLRGRPPAPPDLIVRSLDEIVQTGEAAPDGGLGSVFAPRSDAPMVDGERELRLEVTAHIERVGDQVFGGSAWVGRPGSKRRIEGFSIKPLEEIQPSDIQYKALHPGGVETPWISGPMFCGSRGRSLPLTGIAVRIAPQLQDHFSVVYQAAFFGSGIIGPRSNGAPCLPNAPGDTLEAINVRVTQSRAG
jgi:hypothetical protein